MTVGEDNDICSLFEEKYASKNREAKRLKKKKPLSLFPKILTRAIHGKHSIIILLLLLSYLPNPSARAGYDTRSIF